MSDSASPFDEPGIHVIATDADVDDAAALLTRLSVRVDAVLDGDVAFSPFQDAAENLFLGHEPRRFGLVDRSRMRREAAEVFDRLGLDLDVDGPVPSSPEDQLLFAVGRSMVRGLRRCAVNADRSPAIAALHGRSLSALTRSGVSLVVVGASVGPLLASARTISVATLGRPAQIVGRCVPGVGAPDQVVALLTANIENSRESSASDGRAASARERDENPAEGGRSALSRMSWLSLTAWTVSPLPGSGVPIADNVDLDLVGGTITAVTGRGSRELIASLFGGSLGPPTRGRVILQRGDHADSIDVGALSAADAIAAGCAYGSEDPLSYDIGMLGGIPSRVSGATLKRLAASGVVDDRRSYQLAKPTILTSLGRSDDAQAFTRVLHSWQQDGPSVILLDEPLRRDPVARASALRGMSERGAVVVIVASRPDDIAALADRLVVVENGAIVRDERLPVDGARSRYRMVVSARLGAPASR